jgi:hypothetical protein
VLDVEEFARYMAAQMLIGHRDGYCLRTNNYRLYRNEADGRFVFIPHDLHAILADPTARLLPPMNGLLARAVLASDEGRRLYVRALREVLERCWRLPELSQLIVAATARLQPVLAQHDGRRAKQQLTAVEFLLRRLEEREREARHQLRELEFDVGLLRTAQAARPAPVGK